MKSPLQSGAWLSFDEVDSTQTLAAEMVRGGLKERAGVVFARHQTDGKGRFGRKWLSQPGDSLTMTLIFEGYADHKHPWLIGMAVACAAAGAIHSRVRWPNDLSLHGKKVGGILTELVAAPNGRLIPVVGVGINLNQLAMDPEIAEFATSVRIDTGQQCDAQMVGKIILNRLEALPEPENWSELAPIWALFDQTAGKKFKLASGEEAVAISVGPSGELVCSVNGETTSVMAADAIFG